MAFYHLKNLTKYDKSSVCALFEYDIDSEKEQSGWWMVSRSCLGVVEGVIREFEQEVEKARGELRIRFCVFVS